MQVTRGDGLVDAQQAAAMCRVTVRAIHKWVERGHLSKAGIGTRRGTNGRLYDITLFRPADVRHAEAELRPAARRIILPPAA